MIVFNKPPRRIWNYKNLILNARDSGFIMAPLSAMVKISKPFRFPGMLKRDNNYKWSIIDDYYRSDLSMMDVPMHYAIERVVNEYDLHIGTPLCNRSWWIDDMITSGVLNSQFKNCRLICVCDDFFENIPDERMWAKLWHALFSSWERTTGYTKNRIHWIDEIIDWGTYEQLKRAKKIDYNIVRSQFFNRQLFDSFQMYYRKY